MPSDIGVELAQLRREYRQLHEERERLRAAHAPDEPAAAFAFIEQEHVNHLVQRLCRVLGVSPSGNWAWKKRPPSARFQADQTLLNRIQAIHAPSGGTYGVLRVHTALATQGIHLLSLGNVYRGKSHIVVPVSPAAHCCWRQSCGVRGRAS